MSLAKSNHQHSDTRCSIFTTQYSNERRTDHGRGLAGLINSILLARKGLGVTLFEKKSYPFHRVCGEYISNEVLPFLVRNGLFPHSQAPARISRFQLTSVNGKVAEMPLDLGAFGVSRYTLDLFLYQKALEAGVEVRLHSGLTDIRQVGDHFLATDDRGGEWPARLAIGAFGKRSNLDKKLDRAFMQQRSPYVGVKYHLRTDFPQDLIALHNFQNGYCGISKIEGDRYNLCYLTHRSNLKPYRDIAEMEQAVLWQNPFLKRIFQESDFLFEKPEVINEISFAPKTTTERGVLMSGDAAGMITPLCGNGMAMAIHSAALLSETILAHWKHGQNPDLQVIEKDYSRKWAHVFRTRLWAGRQIQQLFGSTSLSNFAVFTANRLGPVARFLMKQTHGERF